MTDTSGSGGYAGQQNYNDPQSGFNQNAFDSDQAMGLVRTHIPVTIIAVHADPNGGPPMVDVKPVIKTMDAAGNVFSHDTIYSVVAHRHQAGDFAIIADPQPGDVGSMSISDRDISALVANGGQESQPGSFRRHDLMDGIYHAQFLNKAPKHFIRVNRDSNGNVTSLEETSPAMLIKNGVTIDANGNITTPGNITAGSGTSDSVTLLHHTHPGTPPPTPGT